jgi:hypothetical protein
MLMGVLRMFESLPAEFVSGQTICFAMGFSGGGVGVSCQIMEFRGPVVRALGHDVLLAGSMQTGRQSRRKKFGEARITRTDSTLTTLSAEYEAHANIAANNASSANRALTR